jgi:hypothetical protein
LDWFTGARIVKGSSEAKIGFFYCGFTIFCCQITRIPVEIVQTKRRARRFCGRSGRQANAKKSIRNRILTRDWNFVVEKDEPQREEEVDAELLVDAVRDAFRVGQVDGALDVNSEAERRVYYRRSKRANAISFYAKPSIHFTDKGKRTLHIWVICMDLFVHTFRLLNAMPPMQ